MHGVAIAAFTYSGVTYKVGDGVHGSALNSIQLDPIFKQLIVPAPDPGDVASPSQPTSGNGVPDMPFVSGTFNVPASASTSNVFSATPIRVLQIINTDSNPQPAVVKLFDCTQVANIPSAHQICALQLGPGEVVSYQYLCQYGLCWQITPGDAGATALNSTGSGVDVTYANT